MSTQVPTSKYLPDAFSIHSELTLADQTIILVSFTQAYIQQPIPMPSLIIQVR
jgi:hypothetical protein